jgi:hypothetical protein
MERGGAASKKVFTGQVGLFFGNNGAPPSWLAAALDFPGRAFSKPGISKKLPF